MVVVFLAGRWVPGGIYSVYVVVAIAGAALALAGLVWSGVSHLRRRRRIAHNPLDPSLRDLVASDLSWESCAQHPEYAETILANFRFLIEEEGFKPARFVPPRQFLFRKGKAGVYVAQRIPGGVGTGIDLTSGMVCLYRSEEGMAIVEACTVQVEGYNERGLAFKLKNQLDTIIRALESGDKLPEGVERVATE